MNATQIPPVEIDFEVHKALYSLTTYPNEPFNDVLRRLFNLDLASIEPGNAAAPRRFIKLSHKAAPLSPEVQNLSDRMHSAKAAGTLVIKNVRRGINVTGIEINDGKGIRVLKGSRFSKTAAPKFKGGYAELRARLLRQGILNSNFELTQDYPFNSKSAAASVILGTQANANPWA